MIQTYKGQFLKRIYNKLYFRKLDTLTSIWQTLILEVYYSYDFK